MYRVKGKGRLWGWGGDWGCDWVVEGFRGSGLRIWGTTETVLVIDTLGLFRKIGRGRLGLDSDW